MSCLQSSPHTFTLFAFSLNWRWVNSALLLSFFCLLLSMRGSCSWRRQLFLLLLFSLPFVSRFPFFCRCPDTTTQNNRVFVFVWAASDYSMARMCSAAALAQILYNELGSLSIIVCFRPALKPSTQRRDEFFNWSDKRLICNLLGCLPISYSVVCFKRYTCW